VTDALAWYAAYGSNVDETRFGEYLAGCSEPTQPLDDRPFVLDLPLYFAGTGRPEGRWGLGGVAFVRVARDDTPATLGRAWLLPAVRLAEIGAQENRLPLDRAALDVGAGDHQAFPDRAYDSWIRCGELEGVPVFTLTSSEPREPVNPPGPAYVAVVARGLRARHGMTREAVASYLADRTNLPVGTLMEWQPEGEG
jgi:hypothetical protein